MNHNSSLKRMCCSLFATALVALCTSVLCVALPTFALADDTTDAPVTITYEGNTTETWDGTASKEISANATVTINSDFTQSAALIVSGGATVTVNGDSHTITSEINSTLFQVGKSDDTETSSLTVNNLTINRKGGTGDDSSLFLVGGNLALNKTNVTNAVGNIILLNKDNAALELTETSLDSTSVPLSSDSKFFPTISGSSYNVTVTLNSGDLASTYGVASGTKMTFIINGGTVSVKGRTNAVNVGSLYMYGGVVQGTGNVGNGFLVNSGASAQLVGGSIQGFDNGVYAVGKANVVVGDTLQLNNSDGFFLEDGALISVLAEGATYTDANGVEKTAAKWNETASVYVKDIQANKENQITTNGSSQEILNNLKPSSYQSAYSKDFNSDDQYVYFWRHTHSWSLTKDSNSSLHINCSVTYRPCTYAENGLKLSISAEDMTYNGSAYPGAAITDEITPNFNFALTQPAYVGIGNTEYDLSEPPTEVGTYRAYITFADDYTIYDDFEIKAADDGDKGDTGDKDDNGDTGDKDDNGDTGDKDDNGDTGDTGDKDDNGDTGDTGDKGDTGDTGDTGDKGDNGSNSGNTDNGNNGSGTTLPDNNGSTENSGKADPSDTAQPKSDSVTPQTSASDSQAQSSSAERIPQTGDSAGLYALFATVCALVGTGLVAVALKK